MIDFPITDTHVHLLDTSKFKYSWASGAPKLGRDWTIHDLEAAAKPYVIENIVFVEVDVDYPQHMEEAEWVQQLAAGDSRLKGCVAALPLEQGAKLEADLEKLSSFPVVRGIRRLIQNQSDPEFVLRPDFIAATKLLPKFNYSFDICIYHHQFGNVIEFVRRCPEVSFILDHIGKPGIRDGHDGAMEAPHPRAVATAQRDVQAVGRDDRSRPRQLDARTAAALHRPRHRQLRFQPHHVWRRLAGVRAGRKIHRLDRRARLGDIGLHAGGKAQALPRQRNSGPTGCSSVGRRR